MITDLFDDRQDPRLAVIITICTDSQINFFLKGICLICGSELEYTKQLDFNTTFDRDTVGLYAPVGRSKGNLLPGFYLGDEYHNDAYPSRCSPADISKELFEDICPMR
jgi:hypothetical protein